MFPVTQPILSQLLTFFLKIQKFKRLILKTQTKCYNKVKLLKT